MKRFTYNLLLLTIITLYIPNICAKEYFYKNDNDVSLSKKEYDFISNMYWEGYQEYLTKDDYNYIKSMNVFDKSIIKKEEKNIESSLARNSSVTSNLRTLTITKSCSDNCILVMVNRWNGTPTIKSYDVFGVRVKDVSLIDIRNALVSGKNYAKSYSNAKKYNNGFGYSILVPETTEVKTTLTFTTSKKGIVYGSYQHAMKKTTEATSKQYTIGVGGYGKVFNFTGNAGFIYENSPGVDIEV